MADLLVIVPSRGRPESVARVTAAWRETDAYEDADLVFLVDADDPRHAAYWDNHLPPVPPAQVRFATVDEWMPMVRKLNQAALMAATSGEPAPYFAIGFAGDDHLPRTPGWARAYLDALRELGTGIVYGNDLLQGERLPTQWAMTSDIVRALGRMVPADVDHLYCDNAIKTLGVRADCLAYLPHVVVEHVHPVARKASWDAGYRRVNAPAQYRRDGDAYRLWLIARADADAAAVRALRQVAVGG